VIDFWKNHGWFLDRWLRPLKFATPQAGFVQGFEQHSTIGFAGRVNNFRGLILGHYSREMAENENNNSSTGDEEDELVLTLNDVLLVEAPVTLELLPEVIETKLERAAERFQRPYVIDHTLYKNVYITSDIHADLEKLDTLLQNMALVRRPAYSVELGITREAHMICNTEWNVFETLIIIVGDIVDGRRADNLLEIPDAKGNIELLLHMYLYNLRIKANALYSELRFTVGNHDFHTVIEDHTNLPHFYVHRTAQRFFVNREGRRACLLPFYKCCPYLLLTLSNEIACVHGGFVGYTGAGFEDNTQFITTAQQRIDAAGGDFYALSDAQLNALGTIHDATRSGSGYEVSPLWSRWYAYTPEAGVCAHLNRPENRYKLTVVGHCQTGNSLFRSCCADGAGGHGRAILARPEYTRHNCDRGGCVLLGCRDPTGIPRLAFVDIAMSRAFNPALPLQVRAEVLHLRNNDTLTVDQRFYNVIERLNAGAGGNSELVWTAEPLMLNEEEGMIDPLLGGRRRTRRGRNRRSTRLRRRKTQVVKRRRTYKPKRRL
jgi:hypothetical protein